MNAPVKLKDFKVTALPVSLVPNAVYYVKAPSDTAVTVYVTDATGAAFETNPGASAYDIAVENGFSGTEAEWLASLEGEDGDVGTLGADLASTTDAGKGSALVGYKPTVTGAVGRTVSAKLSDIWTVADFSSSSAAALAAANNVLLVKSGETVTVTVAPSGAMYTTLAAAWTSIRHWIILGLVQITVADGTYPLTATQNLEHEFGENIRIIGNTTTPANVLFTVSTAITAFYAGDGCAIDLIDGIKLQHTDTGTRYSCAGILSDRGAAIRCGSNVVIEGFYWNFYARRNSYLEARDCTSINAGDAGFMSWHGAYIDADGSTSTGSNDSVNGLGSGYVAEAAEISAVGATGSSNWLSGFRALHGGHIKAENSVASSNTGSGYAAASGGDIFAGGGVADGNGRYGWEVEDDESGISGTVTNPGAANTLGLFLPYLVALYGSQPGQIVVSPNANEGRRYDTKGTGAHFFNANSGLQFLIAATSSSVNWVTVAGAATGMPVRMYPGGTDANIGVSHETKGTGSHQFVTGGGLQFAVESTASAVNYVAATGAATGGQPRFYSAGSDTNIPFRIDAKGTGAHYFNNGSGLSFAVETTQVRPGNDNARSCGLSTYRWSNTYSVNFRPGAGTATWTSGTGTPEGAVTATVGSLFTRTDGGAGTTLYIKESGSGNTGWVAK